MSEDIFYRHLKVPVEDTVHKLAGHIKRVNYVPYATVCAILTEEGTFFGASLCSDEDQFEYKKGRLIARGRAESFKNGNVPRSLAAFSHTTDRNECLKILKRAHIVEDNYYAKPIYNLEF